MENKVLFGLIGAPRAGKDSVSSYLETKYGFQSIAFADFIKKEFGISKEHFEELKKTPKIDAVRKQLWDFSAAKKQQDPLYFINKTMEFASKSNSSVVINDIRTPEELHSFFTYDLDHVSFRRVYLVERTGIDTFDANEMLIDSKLSHSLIEDYSKHYDYKNTPGVKSLNNGGVLKDFVGYLDEFFSKEFEATRV